MIGRTIAHYKVTAKLGAGGMGEVYRATDTKLGRDVALKVLPHQFAADAQRMQRFQREAQVLASLNHPNIAAIYGLEEARSGTGLQPVQPGAQAASLRHFALAMELVQGPTLAERIARGAMGLEEALPIARQMAEALEYAHEHGVIHRDLKPANIKLTQDGHVKILDFGLAKALTEEAPAYDIHSSPTLSIAATSAGLILGTAAYMSPEQARGKPVDKRADIWSFGVVLYEMLTGRPMFTGETATDVLAAVVRAEPDWGAMPAELPRGIRELLRRCLTRDEKRRLRDIGEARILLDAKWPPADGPPEAAPPVAARKGGGLVWKVTAAVLLVGVLGLAAAVTSYWRAARDVQTLRANILPPEGTAFGVGGGAGGPVVVSPDGKRLAFVGTGGGKRMLWVRELSSMKAQMLSGTEEAAHPFWSPDSRSIGFFTPGKLKRIDAAGGPTLTVCDIPAGAGSRGGTWSRDGVILFAPSTTSPIFRAPANGGTSTPATQLDAAQRIGTHRWPFFLPDQRHFLYLARASGPGGSVQSGAEGIYVASLDGRVNKLLVRAVSSVAYASGHLLFVRDGMLMAVAFDLARLEVAGDAFPLVDQVQYDLAFSLGAFSVSQNGVLTYHSGGELQADSKLLWMDRSGKELGQLGDPAMYYDARILPDGRQVAVSLYDPLNRNIDLWIYDVPRGLRTRFTFDPAIDRFSVWSPDGSRVVFGSSRTGQYDIYVKPAGGAGTEELLLTRPRVNLYPTDWSPDGQFVMFFNSDPKTGNDLWVLPMTGERKPVPFMVTIFNETDGRFSPDGKWIAYVSNESGADQVYVAPFPGPGGKWQVSTAGGSRPFWRGDGREIVYLAADDRLMATQVNTRGANFEAGATRALFDAKPQRFVTFFPSLYASTRDAQRFLVNTARAPASTAPVTLVVNWPADFKQQF